MNETTLKREDIERAMRAPTGSVREIVSDQNSSLRRAAVLCPIIERAEGLSVILTLRSAHLKAHPGQISFPGGKIDAGDPSPLSAALREAEEEIGLLPAHVDVSGMLEPYATGTGFLVTPFVGFVDSRFRAVPHPGEVAEVFEAPLDYLMDHTNHVRDSYVLEGVERSFYVITVGAYRIWGATAGMLRGLADRVAGHGQSPDAAEVVA